MNVQPLGDRVVVKRIEEERETESGIVIPDSAKGRSNQAEVVAVGTGKRENGDVVKPEVSEGDRVLLGEYSGSEIQVDGEEYVFLNGDEILAVVN